MTHGVTGFTTPKPRKREEEVPHFPLTLRDQAALHSAFAVLLSPLDAVDAEAWRGEVSRCLAEFLGADRAAFQLEAPGSPVLYSEDYPQRTLDSYLEHYHAVDVGRIRREQLGLEVWNRWRLHGENLRHFWESEIHQDFLAPNRIFDSMGLTVPVNGATTPATLFFHREKPGTPEFGERGVALLNLLLPAFKAGVRDLVRYSSQRESLTSHLDSLTEAIAIFDLSGRIVHQNPAFTSMLAGDSARDKLKRAMFDIVQSLSGFAKETPKFSAGLAGKRLTQDVHGPFAGYEVRGSFLGRDLLGAELRIVISLQRLAPQATLSDCAIQERFGLTLRELEIARRLALGESTKELAQSCGISLHTARHHTEKIFQKLGVRTRSQVGPRLRPD
ncbi:MAG TPA: helix-turn-helix transcriptional regulator [Gemmatimonadaceae bacterium]